MSLYADRVFPWLMDRALRDAAEERRAALAPAAGEVLELRRFLRPKSGRLGGSMYQGAALPRARCDA